MLGVVLGADVLLLQRTIRTRALAGVMHPAHQVVVVGFLADAGQVRGEGSALHLVALADRVASHAAACPDQLLAALGVAGLLLRWRVGESALPDIGRDSANLVIVQAEVRHLGGRAEVGGLFQPDRNPVTVQLQANVLQVRPDLFQVLHQAVRLEIELLDAAVELAVRYLERDGFVVQPVRFFIRLGGVRLLHQVGGLLDVFFPLLLELLDPLRHRSEFLRLAVISLVTMATNAAALAEQVLAFAERPAHVSADEHHVGLVAGLAAGFHVGFAEERPQPVLVVSVRLFDAGGGPSVALVARRAAKLFGIVDLQQFRFGMADECLCVVVRLLALRRHRGDREFHRLTSAHVARLAAVHDVGIRHVDLLDARVPFRRFLAQAFDLAGREIHHVVGDVLAHPVAGFGHRLDNFAQFRAQLGAIVANRVVLFLQLRKVVLLFVTVGKTDGGFLGLVLLDLVLGALLGGGAGFGLDLVGEGVDVGAAVGEYALNGEEVGVQFNELLLDLVAARFGRIIGALVRLLEALVLRIALNRLLRIRRAGLGGIEEGAVALLPLMLVGLPGALPVGFVP